MASTNKLIDNNFTRSIPSGTAALVKGLTILNLVADAEEPLRFGELMNLSKFPKPTFIRILNTLIAYGLISKEHDRGTYSLGRRFLEMSHRYWDRFDLQIAASPEIEKLSRIIGETVAVCKLDGDRVVYLDEKSTGGLAVKVENGRQVPLYCTAAGKALLAALHPSVSRGILEKLTLDSLTPNTITDPNLIQADLTLTRARGYAVSFEEYLEGVNSVACSLPGQDGNPIGALVALGPSTRFNLSNIHPAGRELIAAARRITGHAGSVAISARPRPRNRLQRKVNTECALPWGAQLGEAPIWHSSEQKLYWVDILHPGIYRFDPSSGINEICEPGKLVSAVLFGNEENMRAVSQDGIENFNFDEAKLTALVDPESGITQNRLNDAKVSPRGSIWVGSMCLDASRPTGSLYRISEDLTVNCQDNGITVANGLDWSPDGKIFYFVDTILGCIFMYDYNAEIDAIKNKRIFAEIPESQGRPDGLCVDSEGGVWCAIWDGWCINRYHPDGTLDIGIELPVPRPTSITFGGSNLQTLFVTSARTRLPATTLTEAPLSGGILACETEHFGLPPSKYC